MFLYLIPSVIGTALMWRLSHETHKVGVHFGNYILGSCVCSLVLALQMPVTNLGGYTKRNTGVALVFIAYCAGNVIGPHAFLAREAPLYQTGCKVILACSCTQTALAIGLRLLLTCRNQKRDQADSTQAHENSDGLADLTEFENRNFRYVL
ncbi:hypothetical protein N7492_007353 [Penicillium capsulatum]|uniref:Allantoate permease n=1 Tax=Penicillium capsulatum TaxID=69766 RepID=A0A9W9I250_9EURO|nr:hypothetical protein N7492_007353 [Penicillium capsulatum]KAJ6117192.1 hypothetical protein N7512_006917 [Penicillium capsulatum]